MYLLGREHPDRAYELVESKRTSRGPKKSSYVHIAVIYAIELFRPALREILRPKKERLRRKGLPFCFEDEVIDATCALMEREGMPVSAEALRAKYRNTPKGDT